MAPDTWIIFEDLIPTMTFLIFWSSCILHTYFFLSLFFLLLMGNVFKMSLVTLNVLSEPSDFCCDLIPGFFECLNFAFQIDGLYVDIFVVLSWKSCFTDMYF